MTATTIRTQSTRTIDRGLVLVRAALGTVFLAHGLQKLIAFGPGGTAAFLESIGVPLPGVNAVALIAVETVGGLLLLAGLFTRTAGALLAFAMLVALVTVHLPHGYFLPDGAEFVLTLMLSSLALTQTGPGRYSLDAWLETRSAGTDEGSRLRPAA